MTSINVIQATPFTLSEPIGTSETEIAVKNFVDIYGERVVMSGDIQYCTIDPLSAENQEIISFTGIEETTSTISTLLGVTRALDAKPDPVTGLYGTDPANERSHGANITCILSDNPQVWDKKTSKDEDETITGYWDFTHLPTSQGGNATDSDQLITYAQALALATGTASINRIVVSGYAGETIAIGDVVYLKASDNRYWKASASASASSENVLLGIAQGAGTAGNAILNGVMLR